jgi:protein TonB
LSEFIRLFWIPLAISLLVIRGGYWLQERATASAAPEQTSTIQVRLVVGAEPMSIAAEAPPPPVAPTPSAQPQEEAAEEPDRRTNDPMPSYASPTINSARTSRVGSTAAKAIAPLQSSTATNFQKTLLRHIERYQNYPGLARRLRLQGTVLVLFSMRRDGAVLDVWIKTGSGAPILDQEAIETIRRAQPLPPIPSELPSQLNVVIPVAFNLS